MEGLMNVDFEMFTLGHLMRVDVDYATVSAATRHAVLTLQARLIGERQPSYVYETPDGWFQALKLERFPKWWVRRWPVRMKRHTLEIKTLYPMFKTRIPREHMGPFVTVLVNDTSMGPFQSDTDGLTPQEAEREAILMSQQFANGDRCPTCNRLWYEDVRDYHDDKN